MSDKIKNFFRRKKADQKFKNAGPGHKLNAAGPSKQSQPLQEKPRESSSSNTQLSESAKQAAAAAIARNAKSNEKFSHTFNRSANTIRMQALNELRMEKMAAEAAAAVTSTLTNQKRQAQGDESDSRNETATTNLAVTDVYFRCPFISDEILPKSEWKERIESYLFELYEKNEERPLTACLIIQSCNPKKKKEVKECIDHLTFYLDNILHNLENIEKYRKIRIGNQKFQERVAPIRGGIEFMLGVGFKKVINDEDGQEYLIYDNTDENNANLESFRDALHNAEPIGIELDRNMQVLLPLQANQRTEIPDSFYKLRAQELKHEAQRRHDDIEKMTQLRTKVMREKDAKSDANKYKYSVIRIRFPDAVFLQGTFNVYESVDSIIEFVRAALTNDSLQFTLKIPQTSFCLSSVSESNSEQLSLLDAKLVPTSILIFEPIATTETTLVPTETATNSFLKEEIMLMVTDIAALAVTKA